MKLILIGGAVVLPIVATARTVTTLSGGWMADGEGRAVPPEGLLPRVVGAQVPAYHEKNATSFRAMAEAKTTYGKLRG